MSTTSTSNSTSTSAPSEEEELDIDFIPTKEFMLNASDEYIVKLLNADPVKYKEALEVYYRVHVCPPINYDVSHVRDYKLVSLPESLRGVYDIDETNIKFVDDDDWYKYTYCPPDHVDYPTDNDYYEGEKLKESVTSTEEEEEGDSIQTKEIITAHNAQQHSAQRM